MSPSRRFAGLGAPCTGPEREDTHAGHPSNNRDPIQPTCGTRPGDQPAGSSPLAPSLDGRMPRRADAAFTVQRDQSGRQRRGSLRQAIIDSNNTPGANEIDFAAGLSGTITLTVGPDGPSDTTGLTEIKGPGAAALTVARNSDPGRRISASSRSMRVSRLSSTALTITGGKWPRRRRHLQRRHFDHQRLHHQRQRGRTSMAAASSTSGTLTVNDCTISGNSAGYGAAAASTTAAR